MISLRAAGSVVTAQSPATMTLSPPAGIAANDIIIAAIHLVDQNDTIATPSGWTLLAGTPIKDTNGLGSVLYAFSAPGNVGTHAFVVTGSTAGAIGFELGFQASGALSVDTGASQLNASSATITAPSINTAQDNEMLVGLHGSVRAVTFSAPWGTLAQDGNFTDSGFNEISLAGVYAIQTSAGASGTKTLTQSIASTNLGLLIAIKESGGGGGPDMIFTGSF